MTDDRLHPARPLVAASVAVFRDGRVLLAARAYPPLEGVFTLPGGLVEPGERLMDAALRELREETGVEADPIGALPPIEFIEVDGDGRARRHFVICPHAARWRAGEGMPGPEAKAIRWLREDEIAGLPTTPGLPGVLRGAFALAGG